MQGHAKELFDAYGQNCGWKSWDGRPMPRWSAEDWPEGTPAAERLEVGELVRSHWEASAAASTTRVLAELETLCLEVQHGTLPDTLENTDWKLNPGEIEMVLGALGELRHRLCEDEVLRTPRLAVEGAPLNRLAIDEWRILHDLLARARQQLLAETTATTGRAAATVNQLAQAYEFLGKVALLTFIRGGTSGGSGASNS